MEESVPIPIPIANQKIELFLLAWTTTNFGKLQRSSAQIISFVVSEKLNKVHRVCFSIEPLSLIWLHNNTHVNPNSHNHPSPKIPACSLNLSQRKRERISVILTRRQSSFSIIFPRSEVIWSYFTISTDNICIIYITTVQGKIS